MSVSRTSHPVEGSSSTYSTSTGRLIKIQEILESNYIHQHGNYIKIVVVWSSKHHKLGPISTEAWDFILADDTGHMHAVVFSNAKNDVERLEANNVCNKLKPGSLFQITNFKILDSSNIVLIRDQNKKMLLQNSTLFITPVSPNEDVLLFRNYLPFKFTKFEDLDTTPDGCIIDMIGYLDKIDEEPSRSRNQNLYQMVHLCSTRNVNDGFSKKIAFFGSRVDTIKRMRKRVVYAFMNLEVGSFNQNKNLHTNILTTIFEVKTSEFETFLPQYNQADFVKALFPKRRKSVNTRSKSSGGFPEVPALLENTFELDQLRQPLQTITNRGPPVELTSASSITTECLTDTTKTFKFSPRKRTLSTSVNECLFESTENSGETSSYCAASNTFFNGNNDNDDTENISTLSLTGSNEGVYDFTKLKRPMNVFVTSATAYCDSGRTSYPMREVPRGLALIIHNAYFHHMDNDVRKGGVHDALYLTKFLEACHFQVFLKTEVKSLDLPGILEDFRNELNNNKKINAVFVAILSHGSYGSVEFVDGVSVNLYDDIIYQFGGNKLPWMIERPKVFVVLTCQNFQEEGDTVRIRKVMPEPIRNSGDLKNMIVCFPTAPGCVSLRDIYLGSHYVYVLVDKLMKHAHNQDFETILKKVSIGLEKLKYPGGQQKLSSNYMSLGFNKKLYFNPGLPFEVDLSSEINQLD